MEFNSLKKIYGSTDSITERQPSLLKQLYDYVFGSTALKKYMYEENGTPIEYKKGDIVYVLDDDANRIDYYKALKDTTDRISSASVNWKKVTVSTDAVGTVDLSGVISVSDENPLDSDNRLWFDTIAEVDIDIPDDL